MKKLSVSFVLLAGLMVSSSHAGEIAQRSDFSSLTALYCESSGEKKAVKEDISIAQEATKKRTKAGVTR